MKAPWAIQPRDDPPLVTLQVRGRSLQAIVAQLRRWLRGLPRVEQLEVSVRVWSRAARGRRASGRGD